MLPSKSRLLDKRDLSKVHVGSPLRRGSEQVLCLFPSAEQSPIITMILPGFNECLDSMHLNTSALSVHMSTSSPPNRQRVNSILQRIRHLLYIGNSGMINTNKGVFESHQNANRHNTAWTKNLSVSPQDSESLTLVMGRSRCYSAVDAGRSHVCFRKDPAGISSDIGERKVLMLKRTLHNR
jgi:hypothetical protein